MESPESIALTTPKSAASFAGEHQHLTSQHDTHLVAGATIAAVSGAAASLYAADGGMKLFTNHGPVSIEAHTDAMEILADQSVTVTSTPDRIDVLAKNKIVLQSGQSIITLEGQNITIACPGNFTVKSGTHDWLGGEGKAATLPHLPIDLVHVKPSDLAFRYAYHDGEPVKGAPYQAKLADGSVKTGTLDDQGYAHIAGVKAGSVEITVGEDARPFQKFKLPLCPDDDLADWMKG